jgi:hypothetical protein
VPLVIKCTHCQQPYSVPDSALGKQANCTKCGQKFAITAPPPNGHPKTTTPSRAATAARSQPQPAPQKTATQTKTPTPRSPTPSTAPRTRLTERELLASFREPFPSGRLNFAYRLGILLIAGAVIVLPLIYMSFIALVGYVVYYHAVNDTALLAMGYGRARAFAAMIYVAPLLAGPIAIFFMLKPLLARPSNQERSRSLTRQSEGLLFVFVDRICTEVGAPQPTRIDVDCNVNASAGFRRGMLSMFGNDLVLTIGLPLAAGLTLQEFGGVLAHEFGHFSQGLGMRLSYLVRAIIHWFVRVVYQRDQWDDFLSQMVSELDIRIGWLFLVAQLFVAVGRGLLWILLHFGLAISGIMLRQMEFDADTYEARFAGSKTFGSTAKKLHLLNAAFSRAQLQMSKSLDSRILVEDLPGLIRYHARTMAPEIAPQIQKAIDESTTGLFDSHPCDRARIAAAEALDMNGIFHSTRPASDLFTDFRAQSAATTWDLYIGIFGPKVPRTALVPLEKFAAQFPPPQKPKYV